MDTKKMKNLTSQKEIEKQAKSEMKKDLINWAEKYMQETIKYYGTDKHGISKDDLINYLNKLLEK